jgi:peptidyl-prolyl cis-trans isomerase A (cyclophilin A)
MEAVMRSFRTSLLASAAALVLLAVVPVHGQEGRGKSALLNPAEAKDEAPPVFRVRFDTSAGPFVVEVHRDWAPNGADRFFNLVKRGLYDGNRFYRVTPLVANFGVSGDPEIAKTWLGHNIPDDPPRTLGPSIGEINPRGQMAKSNQKGFLAFTQSGANRRSTQVVIHLDDNSTLDSQMTPFAQVVSGMKVVEKLFAGYGEPAPTGKGPMMTPLYAEGNAYLEREFPKLDYIKAATLAE